MRRLLPLVLLLVAVGCQPNEQVVKSEPVKEKAKVEPPSDFDGEIITTRDDHWVAARLVKAEGEPKGLVLMFHRAGSNMHEYDPIAERVSSWGWDCLKVDQRAGGDMWGQKNLTAAQYTDMEDYAGAYADLEAAMAWALGKQYGYFIVWGSSYSASLVLRLAAENPQITGVVSFSPGEYFGEPGLVASWNSKVKVPRFFAATSQEINGGILDIYQAAPELKGSSMVGYAEGVHGSQTLREEECPERWKDYWKGVEQFFETLGVPSP